MSAMQPYRQFVADFLRLPAERLQDATPFDDVIADSFQAVELLMALQDRFECTLNQDELIGVETLGQLFTLMADKSPLAAD